MVEAYRFDSKNECLDYLKDMFKHEEYRNIDEVKIVERDSHKKESILGKAASFIKKLF